MPALVGSAPNGGYAPWQLLPPSGHPKEGKEMMNGLENSGYPVVGRSDPLPVGSARQLEGGLPSSGFGPGVICRRQKSFYVLLSLLILGVVILVFIVVSATIVYVSHTQWLASRRASSVIRKNPCASLDCLHGAECVLDEGTREPYCKCEETCSPNIVHEVCGSNEVTYRSECDVRVAACSLQSFIYVRNKGSCDKDKVRDGCERVKCEHGSVCEPLGSAGDRAGAGGGKGSPGCRCPENCLDYVDVRTYYESSRSGLEAKVVADESDPFCGEDGKDYPNLCDLKKQSCLEKRNVQVKFKGKCDPCSGIRCPGNQVCLLDENRNPICGCNENKCSATSDGPVDGPVCGSDGRTYTNECSLEDAACRAYKSIRIISRGECKEGTHPCLKLNCTFPMECNVNRYGVASCICPQPCPKIYKPVCGSDTVTYESLCHLQRKSCLIQMNISVLYYGTCGSDLPDRVYPISPYDRAQCSPDSCHFGGVCLKDDAMGQVTCSCPLCSNANYEPVCGTDGSSYDSECHLRRASCEQQASISAAYHGLCRGCEELQCKHYAVCEINFYGISECICPQVCLRVEAPVCGSDHVTYENECELRVRSCKLKANVVVQAVGPCDACQTMSCKHGARCEGGRCVCPATCPEGIVEAICANDGNTYRNECELRKVACINEMDLRALFYGECDDAESDADPNTLRLAEELEGSGDGEPAGGGVDNWDIKGRGGHFQVNLNKEVAHDVRDQDSCDTFKCLFGAACKYNQEGIPYCDCSMDCETQRKKAREGKVGKDRGGAVEEEVCGSDGRWYRSECILREESCKRQIEIKRMKDESCSKSPYDVTNQSGYDCFCNKHGSFPGSDCDPTKQCKCKPGVGGLHCDRCEPAYFGLHMISEGNSGCIPCACNEFGSARDDCEQTTGRCVCKNGVQGMKCDACPPGKVLGIHGCLAVSVAHPVHKKCPELRCGFGANCKQIGRYSQCVCNFNCMDNLGGSDQSSPATAVCGSDGVGYPSQCLLRLYSCRVQEKVTVFRTGPC